MHVLKVFCDGSVSKPRYGTAISGWSIVKGDKEVLYGAKIVEQCTENATVNVAEYMAVLLALKDCTNHRHILKDIELIKVHTDSKLVVEQLNGNWSCNKSNLMKINREIDELAFLHGEAGVSVVFSWIPRSQNKRADELSGSLHNPPLKSRKKTKNA